MRRTSPLFSLAATISLILLSSTAGAVAIDFNDGGVHVVNTDITPDSITIHGTTTVNVQPGAVIGSFSSSSISVFENAILNMTGGDLSDELFFFDNGSGVVSGGTVADDITTSDNSNVTVHDVTNNDDVEADGNSVMTINGGNYDEDVEASGSATVNIHGGMFQTGSDGASFEAAGTSTINLYGGSYGVGQTDGFGYIAAVENGTVNIHGADVSGQPEGLIAEDNGVINIYALGGQPASLNTVGGGLMNVIDGALQNLTSLGDGEIRLFGGDGSLSNINAQGSSVIRIFGHSFFAFNGSIPVGFGPLPFGAGNLSGILADGTPFTNVPFTRSLAGGAQIIIAAVPEPGTLGLLFIAVLVGFAAQLRLRGQWN